jgi:periplasmic divalent cation tolerance protein
MKALIVLSTVGKEEDAAAIARTVVEENLAACVNIVPAVRSLYRWEGAVQDERESLLIIKTTEANGPRLMDRIRALHPYQVPEILAVAVDRGDEPYLRWLQEICGGTEEAEER